MRSNLFTVLACLVLPGFFTTPTPAADAPSPREAQFLSQTRQLTYEGKRSGEGYFSPDGKALIFQSEREPGNPFYQIYLLDLESGDSHRVSPGVGKTTCAFFRPGSDEILFASTHLDPAARSRQKAELELRATGQQRRYSWDYDESMDIFSARRDGSNLVRLTDAPGYDAEASYSPDGKLIAFCSLRAYPTNQLSASELKRLETDPAWFGEIYVMNADGSNPRRLTHTPGYDGGPFFSPDGQRIIWRRFDEGGAIADIYTMKLDGSDVRRLTDFKAMSWAPYYHPSGKYVIFTSNKLGFSNFELHLVDALGEHEPVRVTFTDGFDGLPVFSPDGARLCWTSSRTADSKSQLFIANWNHEAALAALAQAPARGQNIADALPHPLLGEAPPEITPSELRAEVTFLASDNLGGRLTGSDGAHRAAEHIIQALDRGGVRAISEIAGHLNLQTKPRPDSHATAYDQEFEFDAGVRLLSNANVLVLSGRDLADPLAVERDFRPLSFSANGEAEGEVVFAGYGLSVPGAAGAGYNSYAGLDVSNKIALVLRYVPEEVEPKRRAELNRYAGLRYKAMIAREHGAKAVLFVTGPNSPNAGELVGLTSDGGGAGSGIIAASISGKIAQALLAPAKKDLKILQTALDSENPHAESGLLLPEVRLKLVIAIEHLKKKDRNILGFLPPVGRNRAEYILVGAHYDHLGFGESGTLQRKDEEGKVHPGADDNASGTATVLELALSLAGEQRAKPEQFRRGIIFAFWSGEEIGLIGSSYFVEHPLVALSNIAAYVNFDMVGRLRENKLNLQGIGSSTIWRRLIEKRNVAAGFNLVLQEDPYLPTDVTALYPKHVPVLNFFTGSHEDYHRPTDKAETLNYEGMERIGKFARGLLLDLVKSDARPDYVSVAQSDSGGGSRENLRAYLGTIPDYATEVAGVKLSGVRSGSPADAAGLKGGDIIVEFGGQKVANIYDYTYALDAAKIGQSITIVVTRDGQRLSLAVTPQARK